MPIRLSDIPATEPMRLSDISDNPSAIRLSDVPDNPSIGGFIKQAGIGFGNEFALGFPLYALEKARGIQARKAFESDIPVERFGRGLGTTIGMATILPKTVFGLGIKGIQAVGKTIRAAQTAKEALIPILGAEKAGRVIRFGKAMAEGGAGIGAFELAHAPEEDFKEKFITVPTASLFGAATFGVGDLIKDPVKRFLIKNKVIDRGFIGGSEATQRMNDMLKQEVIDDASVSMKTQRIGRFIETKIFDAKAPIRWLQEWAESVSGKTLKFTQKPYEAARNYSNIGEKIKLYSNKIQEIVDKDRTLFTPLNQLMTADRLLERARKGFQNPRGLGEQDSINILRDLRKVLGNEGFAAVRQMADDVRGITKDILFQLRETGVIDRQSLRNILRNNEFYSPFQVLSYLNENPDKFGIGKSAFNVKEPGFLKATEGTEKDVESPISAVMRYIANGKSLVEKNNVVRKLVRLRNVSPEMEKVIIPVRQAENVKERIGIFSDLSELIPLRNKFEKMVDYREDKIYELISEMDKLSEKGIKISLKPKNYYEPETQQELIKKHTRKITTEIAGETIPGKEKAKIYQTKVLLGRRGLRNIIEDFIELSKSEIEKIKKMVSTRENRLSKVVDELLDYSDELTKAKSAIFERRQRLPEIRDIENIPSDYEKIHVFKDGIKEEYAVHRRISDVIKGLNTETIDLMTRFASFQGAMLRLGATTFSLPFAAVNLIRDAQTAAIVSKVGFNVGDWLRGFSLAIRHTPEFDLYVKSGGGFGMVGTFSGGIDVSAKQFVPSISKRVVETLNPYHWIAETAKISENITRLGVFTKGLKAGLKPPEAAYNARNATIDFAKMGTAMRLMNMWVPFLNARTQGTLNFWQAVKTQPQRVALVGSGMIVTPSVSTYLWNQTQFPDVFRDIRRFEKDNNFIFIYGREKDEQGRWLNVVKIPKGDIGKIMSNPIESFLDFLNKNNPESISQLAFQTLSDISPVEFAREGQFTGQALASSLTPPAIKGVLETSFNKNFFTGRDIVPFSLQDKPPEEQYTIETSPIAVKLGDLFDISPMKIENLAGTMFGTLGRQALDPLNQKKILQKRFAGAYGEEELQRRFDILHDIVLDTETKEADNYRLAKQAVVDFRKIPPYPALRKKFIEDTFGDNKKAKEIFVETISAEMNGETWFDSFLKKRPIRDKIKFIRAYSGLLETDKEKLGFMQEIIDKKIITEQSLKNLE